MLSKSKAYSGFAIGDVDKAKEFYGETLGLDVEVLDEENGLLQINHAGDRATLAYQKDDLETGNYTILNFPVDDIDKAVDELSGRGVSFERYEGADQDEKGVFRGLASDQGPDIAWFKDPSGHILAVMQEE
jgi:catechol 2,3-dioxygenase-like lactoylglutathione lyase family enzyme